ncbi:MAG TPA: TolC family protein, partial [Rhodopila sp.]|nr:TolC family protein [Rhodopila sp.]
MTFHEAVARAWDRLPQRQNIGAQRNAAAAQYIAGSALFPNAPSLTGSYINDNMLGSANDFITSQVELSTPIWLPGEGTATQQ